MPVKVYLGKKGAKKSQSVSKQRGAGAAEAGGPGPLTGDAATARLGALRPAAAAAAGQGTRKGRECAGDSNRRKAILSTGCAFTEPHWVSQA